MLQTVHCVRVGVVFLDKNRELILLCENCQTEFERVKDLRAHLEICNGLQHLFLKDTRYSFNSRKGKQIGLKHIMHDINDVRIIETPPVICESYDKDENYFDLIKIEEELLNPRWYTDMSVPDEPAINNTTNSKPTLKCTEPMDVKAPCVQLKKNVKTYLGNIKFKSPQPSETEKLNKPVIKVPVRNIKMPHNEKVIVSSNVKLCENYAKRERISMPPPKTVRTQLTIDKNMAAIESKCSERPVKSSTFSNKSMPKQSIKTQRKEIVVPVETQKVVMTSIGKCDKTQQTLCKNYDISKPTHSIKQPQTPRPPPPQQMQISKIKPLQNLSTTLLHPTESIPTTRTQQTEQILNKLQTLGLQIKRKNCLRSTEYNPYNNTKRNEALEILKKLQSKGMNVKIVNKNVNSKVPAQHQQNFHTKKPKLDPSIMPVVVSPTKASSRLQCIAGKLI